MCVWMCTGKGEADFASWVFCFLWKRNGASTAPGSPKHKAYKSAPAFSQNKLFFTLHIILVILVSVKFFH